jgi:hypothetical protein
MSLKRLMAPLLWLVVLFVLTWISHKDISLERYCHPVLLPSELTNHLPVGEVIAKFHLEQPINWNLLEKTVLEREASRAVCVGFLLANYNDQDNNGTFALTLRVEENQYRTVVNAKTVRDNAYHRICFEDVILGDIAHKPAALLVEGIDSQPGKAITAWMTEDTAHGRAMLRHGTVSARSLAFLVETITSGYEQRIHVIILTIISALSGALILLGSSKRPTNSLSKIQHTHQKNNQ